MWGNWDLKLFKKNTLSQVFSSEFCKISKKTFSYTKLPVPVWRLIQYWWWLTLLNANTCEYLWFYEVVNEMWLAYLVVAACEHEMAGNE